MEHPLDKYVKKPLTCSIFQKQRHIMNQVTELSTHNLLATHNLKIIFFLLFKIMSVNELRFLLKSSLLSR